MRRLWLPTTSFWISFYCSDSNKVRSVQSKVVLDLFWERLYSFTLNFTFERRKPDNRGQWWVVNCHDSWVWVSEADCEVCITGQLLAPWVDDTSNQHRPAFGCSKRNTPMLELTAHPSPSAIDPWLIRHLGPDTDLRKACSFITHRKEIFAEAPPNSRWMKAKLTVLPLLLHCFFFFFVSWANNVMIWKNNSTKGILSWVYTQRRETGAYDANKRARRITRGANSTTNRQLHEPVFPWTERRSGPFCSWWQATGKKIMTNKTWDGHTRTHAKLFHRFTSSATKTASQWVTAFGLPV